MSQRNLNLSSLILTEAQQEEIDSAQSVSLTQSGTLLVNLGDGLENYYEISKDKKLSFLMNVIITPPKPPAPITEVESKFSGFGSKFRSIGFNQYGSHSRQHRFDRSSPVESESDTDEMSSDNDSPRLR
jgi:hypothetical protein